MIEKSLPLRGKKLKTYALNSRSRSRLDDYQLGIVSGLLGISSLGLNMFWTLSFDDMRSSILDNRYKDQKLRLQVLVCVRLTVNNSQINEAMNQHDAYSDKSAARQIERSVMKHQTGFAMEWSSEEQTILENLLATCSLDESSVSRYMRISQELPNKTTRDVAMRCRWIINNGLRSVQVENSHSDHDHPQDELLRQNELLYDQVSANLTSSSKLFENLTLFNKSRENIMDLVNENVPEHMKLMPPLPEILNDHLFYLIFTASNLPNLP